MSLDQDSPDTTTRRQREELPAATNLGLLVLRVLVGVGMAAHGAQKLFGMFNGQGIDGTATFFESVGYSPGRPYAILSGLVELGGGVLLILGLALPFAAAAIVANMVGAYTVVQSATPGDYFNSTGGPELELFYILTAFALILTGPGNLALRVRTLDSAASRLIGVVLAVGGAVAAVLVHSG